LIIPLIKSQLDSARTAVKSVVAKKRVEFGFFIIKKHSG